MCQPTPCKIVSSDQGFGHSCIRVSNYLQDITASNGNVLMMLGPTCLHILSSHLTDTLKVWVLPLASMSQILPIGVEELLLLTVPHILWHFYSLNVVPKMVLSWLSDMLGYVNKDILFSHK